MGGMAMVESKLKLRGGCDLVVATPGRLLDLIEVEKRLRLDRVRFLVLDEADALLSLEMEASACLFRLHGSETLRTLSTELLNVTFRNERQTCLFAVHASEDLRTLSKELLNDHVQVSRELLKITLQV
eukprot:gene18019-24429_t